MEFLKNAGRRVRALLSRRVIEDDMNREMRAHVESLIEEYRSSGMSLEEARLEARRRFGNLALIQEQGRDIRGSGLLGEVVQDIRYAVRGFFRSPAFTVVVVSSLALGIGANAALFSVTDAVLFRKLTIDDPDALVTLYWLSEPNGKAIESGSFGVAVPGSHLLRGRQFPWLSVTRMRDASETLDEIFAFASLGELGVNFNGRTGASYGQLVTGNYFTALGTSTFLGRTILPEDDHAGAVPVAVVSYRYWEREMGADESVIGKTVLLNKVPVTIVGVKSPELAGGLMLLGGDPDFSIPLSIESRFSFAVPRSAEPWRWWLLVMGRLKPGVTPEQAQSNLEPVFLRSAQESWDHVRPDIAKPAPGSGRPGPMPKLIVAPSSHGYDDLWTTPGAMGDVLPQIAVFALIVGLILLAVCTNVANLLLARIGSRNHEIAIRFALGGSRFRLIRQLLTESIVLSLSAGALGILVGYWAKNALQLWASENVGVLDLRLDPRVLGATFLLSLLTGFFFGTAPAIRSTRANVGDRIKERFRLGKFLLAAQVALSVVLLVTAGIFLRSLQEAWSVDPGFDTGNLLVFRIDPRLSGYRSPQIAEVYEPLIRRIEAVPGVKGATMSQTRLLTGRSSLARVFLQDDGSKRPRTVATMAVRSNFFELMGIPIALGRTLSPNDNRQGAEVAVINEAMARQYFPDENPVGKRLGFQRPERAGDVEIVGVVKDSRHEGLRQRLSPVVYTSYLQQNIGQMEFEVRTALDPSSMAAAVRSAVAEVDKDLPLIDLSTQDSERFKSEAENRLFTGLASLFGVLAVSLACIGLYGLMSYTIAQRTSEIGVRMALGARHRDVIRLIMREALALVVGGIVIGVAGAVVVATFLGNAIYAVSGGPDYGILGVVVVSLIGVTSLAAYLAARKILRIEPLTALRYE